MEKSVFDYTYNRPNGQAESLEQYRGKVLLLVNTATKCGFTPQLGELEELHNKYKDDGLVVLGFPSNEFGGQEPESNDNIEEVCLINHGVTFPLSEKIRVNSKEALPLWKYLKKEKKGLLGSSVKWNFTKFLVDRQGKPFKRYGSTSSPSSIEDDIRNLLGL